jgi:hypothetical protein
MDIAGFDALQLVLTLALGVFAGLVSDKGSTPLMSSMRLIGAGIIFLVLAAAGSAFLRYPQADIQMMFMLRETPDFASVGSSVVVGYGLLIGASIRIARTVLNSPTNGKNGA